MSVTRIYYEHDGSCAPPFRGGEAGLVWIDASGELASDTRVAISPNTLHALHGLGVVTRLASLPFEFGSLEADRESLLSPTGAEPAMRIFYEADRKTYGQQHDLLVCEEHRPRPTQYRLRVDNREYQRSLSQLQFLCREALHQGCGVRLHL